MAAERLRERKVVGVGEEAYDAILLAACFGFWRCADDPDEEQVKRVTELHDAGGKREAWGQSDPTCLAFMGWQAGHRSVKICPFYV